MTYSVDGGDTSGEGPTLSLDAILDLLAHHHRRAILETLRNSANRTAIEDELISQLQAQEERRTGVQPSWDHMSASLHHIHEPKLSEAGVVTYDESAQTYHYHPHDKVEQWLDHIHSVHDDELYRYNDRNP